MSTIEQYKNWKDQDYNKVLEKKNIPLKMLAILRASSNFWDILYMDPRMGKSTRK